VLTEDPGRWVVHRDHRAVSLLRNFPFKPTVLRWLASITLSLCCSRIHHFQHKKRPKGLQSSLYPRQNSIRTPTPAQSQTPPAYHASPSSITHTYSTSTFLTSTNPSSSFLTSTLKTPSSNLAVIPSASTLAGFALLPSLILRSKAPTFLSPMASVLRSSSSPGR